MKKIIFIFYLLSIIQFLSAQEQKKDSLLTLLLKTKQDTARINLLFNSSSIYDTSLKPDSVIFFATQGLELAQITGDKKAEINFKQLIALNSWRIGDFATAIKLSYSTLEYAKSINDSTLMGSAYRDLCNSYRDQGDYREAINLMWKYLDIISINDSATSGTGYAFIGSNYYGLENYDSAYFYLEKAFSYPKSFSHGWVLRMAGLTLEKMNDIESAFDYFRESISELETNRSNSQPMAQAYTSIAALFEKTGQTDSAVYYGKKGLVLAQEKNYNKELLEANLQLAKVYEKISTSDALNYYKQAMELNTKLYNLEKQKQISSFKFNEELRQIESRNEEQLYRNRIKMFGLLGLLSFFLVFIVLLYRNFKNKQKANVVLQKTLADLKSTQSQLIQSEKMASLGELTAGIAHEIQNPLNFVNNFSEVNDELIEELRVAVANNDHEEIQAILNDLQENESKIKHHGQRAEGIVKGMLMHSRTSQGEKEPTDINALADEYLRLAYHGMRAKDKSFNAEFKTEFDEKLPKVNVVPQDIGRVLLNLINNAFYAVGEKTARHSEPAYRQKGSGVESGAAVSQESYKPEVLVSTRRVDDKIEISVKDNGPGIPEQVRDKIFQPFFTTKPTGSGTGLGLSLSYDIVKAHGGEIEVDSTKEIGTIFKLTIPI